MTLAAIIKDADGDMQGRAAVEAALRLKSQGNIKVTAVCLESSHAEPLLR